MSGLLHPNPTGGNTHYARLAAVEPNCRSETRASIRWIRKKEYLGHEKTLTRQAQNRPAVAALVTLATLFLWVWRFVVGEPNALR